MKAKTQTVAQKPKERRQLGILVDVSLWKRFRASAILHNETATEAVERVMAEELKRQGQKAV
jgi:hypothetical protein